jgi:hypothetical protein
MALITNGSGFRENQFACKLQRITRTRLLFQKKHIDLTYFTVFKLFMTAARGFMKSRSTILFGGAHKNSAAFGSRIILFGSLHPQRTCETAFF